MSESLVRLAEQAQEKARYFDWIGEKNTASVLAGLADAVEQLQREAESRKGWMEASQTELDKREARIADLEAGIENIAGSLHEGIAYHQVRGALFALRWVRPPEDVTEDDLERGREVAAALLDSGEDRP